MIGSRATSSDRKLVRNCEEPRKLQEEPGGPEEFRSKPRRAHEKPWSPHIRISQYVSLTCSLCVYTFPSYIYIYIYIIPYIFVILPYVFPVHVPDMFFIFLLHVPGHLWPFHICFSYIPPYFMHFPYILISFLYISFRYAIMLICVLQLIQKHIECLPKDYIKGSEPAWTLSVWHCLAPVCLHPVCLDPFCLLSLSGPSLSEPVRLLLLLFICYSTLF